VNELTRLLTEAAANLSGHPVRVRWRRPARADARAIAFKSGGTAIIDLHPGLSWEGDDLLHVICHEAAHVKQLWADWGAGIPDYASGSIRPSNYALSLPGVKQTETAADTLAADWLDYAEKNHMKFIKHDSTWNDETSLYLRALAGMNQKELKR